MSFRVPLVLAAAAVSACATYEPAPLSPRALAAAPLAPVPDLDRAQVWAMELAPAYQGRSWDRLTLLATALHANPQIRAARARTVSAKADARAARHWPAVSLTLTAEYARSAPESSPWLYGAAVDAPLDLGGARAARIGAGEYAAIAAAFDEAETVWTTRQALNAAVADLLVTRRETLIGEALNAVRVRQLAALTARLEAGASTRADVERVRVEAAADALRLNDAQARLAAAQTALANALGLPRRAVADLVIDWEDFDAPALLDADMLTRAEAEILPARSDILRAAAAYDQAEANVRGEVARQWPLLRIGPGYTWERGLVKLPFSLSVQLPGFDLNRAAIEAAEARRAEAGAVLEGAVAQARNALEAALADRAAAISALDQIRDRQLAGARAAASQADAELAQGAIDRVDWCAAHVSLQLALLAEADALRRVRMAEAALEDALRRPIAGPELLIAKQRNAP